MFDKLIKTSKHVSDLALVPALLLLVLHFLCGNKNCSVPYVDLLFGANHSVWFSFRGSSYAMCD